MKVRSILIQLQFDRFLL